MSSGIPPQGVLGGKGLFDVGFFFFLKGGGGGLYLCYGERRGGFDESRFIFPPPIVCFFSCTLAQEGRANSGKLGINITDSKNRNLFLSFPLLSETRIAGVF